MYYENSLKIEEEMNNLQQISLCNSNIGLIHLYKGKYDEALKYLTKSFEIIEKIGDRVWVANH